MVKPVYVSASAFNRSEIEKNGQIYCIPLAKAAGCSGIEIRRELFSNPIPLLNELRSEVKNAQFECVYSAPVQVWDSKGILNRDPLNRVLQEGIQLGAKLIKTCLGSYQEEISDLQTLTNLISELNLKQLGVQLTVENDQTYSGGRMKILKTFFDSCKQEEIPISMTFDIGNWNWVGEDALDAARLLHPFVEYIHLKYVEKIAGQLTAQPLKKDETGEWKQMLEILPNHIPLGIEFPLDQDHLIEDIRFYVDLLNRDKV